jgi:methylenetetrahydrofolate dehydrogenase (NADP+)/methenyltetrahydrofolate cyclohydrolase
MKILDGKMVSEKIFSEISEEIDNYIKLGYPQPNLVVIMVGDNPASQTYVNNKQKAAQRANINSQLIHFEESITEDELINQINILNVDKTIDGFFIQLPLPNHINKDRIIGSIDPKKDVDGFHPLNFGKMALGQDGFKPATPYGICKLLKYYNIETKGKHCVVIGRSNIVGKPISIMLGNEFQIGRCTVTSTHIDTPPELLKQECLTADIIIVAVGKPGFLKSDMVKEGAIVIDVGINRLDGKICGDIDEEVYSKCDWVTPVPGGVGPMTIASLMYNTLLAYRRKL